MDCADRHTYMVLKKRVVDGLEEGLLGVVDVEAAQIHL
jgi:hypothetical protein